MMRAQAYGCILIILSSSVWGQTFPAGINRTIINAPVSLPVPCLGLASECSANNNASLHNGTHSCSSGTCAGSVLNETDLNPSLNPPIQYLRVTDAAYSNNNCWHEGMVGDGNENQFSSDNTRFVVGACGGGPAPFSFDTLNYTFVKLYGNSYYLGQDPSHPAKSSQFSRVTAKKIYTIETDLSNSNHATIFAYDLTSTTTAPTIANLAKAVVVDLQNNTTTPNCLGAISGFVFTWNSILNVSDDDTEFVVAVGDAGTSQDNAHYVVVWNATSGCRILDVWNAVINIANWGPTGTINNTDNGTSGTPAKFGIHDVHLSHDGQNLEIEGNTCQTTYCSSTGPSIGNVWGLNAAHLFRWQINSLNVAGANIGDTCGHNTFGYNLWSNKCIFDESKGPVTFLIRSWANFANAGLLLNPSQASAGFTCSPIADTNGTTSFSCPNLDHHPAWWNDNQFNPLAQDTMPVWTSTFDSHVYIPAYHTVTDFWTGEIIALDTNCYPGGCTGHNPYRFAHTYSDATDQRNFTAYIGVGSVSAFPSNGYWYYLFTSDWQGQFGCDDGSYCVGGISTATDNLHLSWYITGGTITGTTGQTCTLTFNNNGGSGGTATVALTGTNVIKTNVAATPPTGLLTITATGSGYFPAPTTAALSNGTATCSGTATVNTQLAKNFRADAVMLRIPVTTTGAPLFLR